MTKFIIDSRITSTCFELTDWPLSRIFLKNNANYPWLILVPRFNNIQEIDQLPQSLQHTLIDEISAISSIMRTHFQPDKLNVGALGNIVAQLHIHVVARFTHDKLWPHSVWQSAEESISYETKTQHYLIAALRENLNLDFSHFY